MVPPKDEACATVTGEPQTGFSVGAVLAPARTTAPARRSPSNNNGYCFVLLKYSPLPVLSSSWKPCFLQPLHQLHRWTKIRTQFVFKHVSEKWGEIFRNLRCRFQKFKEFIVHFWNSYGSFFYLQRVRLRALFAWMNFVMHDKRSLWYVCVWNTLKGARIGIAASRCFHVGYPTWMSQFLHLWRL